MHATVWYQANKVNSAVILFGIAESLFYNQVCNQFVIITALLMRPSSW